MNGWIKYPEVISIIERNNPGTIFVDDIETPQVALVWNQGMKGFYFIGNCKNKRFLDDINKFIDTDIASFLNEKNIDYFECSTTSKKWDKMIEKIFEQKGLESWEQLIYFWDENKKLEQVESKYTIYSLKDRNIQPVHFSNWDYYEKVLKDFWDDVKLLKEKGNCYYAVDRNEIIGVCYSGFVTSKYKTIGIETDEKYRKQGVAYHLALRCIVEILEEEMLPWWDCTKANIPSVKLAEKLGFLKHQEYNCYCFKV